MTTLICPKCQYMRGPADGQAHPDLCPACGIAYSKWLAKHALPSVPSEPHTLSVIYVDDTFSLRKRIHRTTLYVPDTVDPLSWWCRAGLWLGLLVWGGYFIWNGIDWEILGGSFLHNVNLAFHEFGHVFFIPFGHFMMILGGSLFQIMLPLFLTGVFLIRQRDTFAASITLWWCGQSFMDLSPYIADAEARALPLVGGMGEEAHDWGNLLTMMNAVEHSPLLARASFGLGTVIMLTALYWGYRVLQLQRDRLSSPR